MSVRHSFPIGEISKATFTSEKEKTKRTSFHSKSAQSLRVLLEKVVHIKLKTLARKNVNQWSIAT